MYFSRSLAVTLPEGWDEMSAPGVTPRESEDEEWEVVKFKESGDSDVGWKKRFEFFIRLTVTRLDVRTNLLLAPDISFFHRL